MKKYIIGFYTLLLLVVLILRTQNILFENTPFVGIIFGFEVISIVVVAIGLNRNLWRLIFHSYEDWIEASVDNQRNHAYPGIPMGISRTLDDAEQARRNALNTFGFYLGITIIQVVTFYFLLR